MYNLIKYVYRNYFTLKTQTESKDQKINDVDLSCEPELNYNYILRELSKESVIKYIYMKDNISGLLMIKYTELNFFPLYDTIRNQPSDYGYGDFEMKIISLYNDMIKRKNIINILNITTYWDLPREISIYICQIFWNIIN